MGEKKLNKKGKVETLEGKIREKYNISIYLHTNSLNNRSKIDE